MIRRWHGEPNDQDYHYLRMRHGQWLHFVLQRTGTGPRSEPVLRAELERQEHAVRHGEHGARAAEQMWTPGLMRMGLPPHEVRRTPGPWRTQIRRHEQDAEEASERAALLRGYLARRARAQAADDAPPA